MGLLLKPFLGCNLKCKYCYEGSFREKYDPEMNYDIKALLKTIRENKDSQPTMSLHGGESLMLPNKDIEIILKEIYKHKKKAEIQTNGTLIDDEKIKLFKKYNVSVGISWDGPGELCAFRPGTEKVGETIDKLIKEGVEVGMIIVISEANAGTKKKLNLLKDFLLEIHKKGISPRINPCYSSFKGLELNTKKAKEVYLELADFCIKNDMFFPPFTDIVDRLKRNIAVCFFMGCDIFSTESAVSVMNDGSTTNCMRTNQKYILLRDKRELDVRDQILRNTPQEEGGCRECKYFEFCRGGCPTATIDDDWRNRTRWCEVFYALFEYFEKMMEFTKNPRLYKYQKEKEEKEKKDIDYSDHTDMVIKN